MYHYSYVFPNQVSKKIGYYKAKVSRQNCIDNYFENIYLPWVLGDQEQKFAIESKYLGVHEFIPSVRGECFTTRFFGDHPESIKRNVESLKAAFSSQLQVFSPK